MYFFDSYALIEFNKGNPEYQKYSKETIHTTILNLYEFFYSALAEFGEEKAKEAMSKLNAVKVDISESDVVQASKFRLSNKQKKLSYADALGYEIARSNKLKFLTGDMQFRTLENVEYVK